MTRSLALSIQSAIDEFVAGENDIADLQGILAGYASALDGRFSDLAAELRAVDADLEKIQFAMLRDEQRPAAIFRLERARELATMAAEASQDEGAG